MYFALYSDTARFGKDGGYQTIGDVFRNGAPTALIGLLTVFAVLAIVWGALEFFHLVSHGRKPKQKNAPAQISAPPTPIPPPAAVTAPAPETAATTNDEEIVAVIAAAIAAAQSEQPSGSFRVVSFKRK